MIFNNNNIILLTYFLMLSVAVVQFRIYKKILENERRFKDIFKMLEDTYTKINK